MALNLTRTIGLLCILGFVCYLPLKLSLTDLDDIGVESRIERIQNSELYVLLAEVDGAQFRPVLKLVVKRSFSLIELGVHRITGFFVKKAI